MGAARNIVTKTMAWSRMNVKITSLASLECLIGRVLRYLVPCPEIWKISLNPVKEITVNPVAWYTAEALAFKINAVSILSLVIFAVAISRNPSVGIKETKRIIIAYNASFIHL
jgi:hypothetical protein